MGRRAGVFVGGDAGVLQRHRTLLEAVAAPQHIVHLGGLGAGYASKLLVNLLWFGQAIATTEALLLARRLGIDVEVMHATLNRSAAASEFIRRDLPSLLDGDYVDRFGLDRCHEELLSVVSLARGPGVSFELSSVVERIYRRACDRYGARDGDLLPVAMLEEETGLLLWSSVSRGGGDRS